MKFIFKIFPFLWLGVFATIICLWIVVGALTIKAGTSIREDGLKKTVEKVWCADNKDCKVP